MADISKLLREEIKKVARREARQEVAALRAQVQKLRERVRGLEAKKSEASKRQKVERAKAAVKTESRAKEGKGRFSSERLRAWRDRVGLSRRQLALVLEKSEQAVYLWETGSRPQQPVVDALSSLRKLGKRELQALVQAKETAAGK